MKKPVLPWAFPLAAKRGTPAPAVEKAVEGRDYSLLDAPPPRPRRTTGGQDLPVGAFPPLYAPALRVKVGELSGKRLVSYDGDDVWYCVEQGGVTEARRCWIMKYGDYFPEAARLLRIEAKEVESLLS